MGESLKTIRANEPLDQVTTTSLEALRMYSQAVRASEMGNNERAIALLEEAVAVDTGFAASIQMFISCIRTRDALVSPLG